MILGPSISSFVEVVCTFGRGDGGKKVDDGVVDGQLSASGSFAQTMLEL